MKIRIQGNSLRFRLKQYEVESFREKGIIKEMISFGPEEKDQLRFILCRYEQAEFSLEQNGMTIQLNIPAAIADNWTHTETVGFEQMIESSKGEPVKILVEKDFKCLDGREEDNIGAYPNPMKAC
jgi:hypothetical protein